MSSEQAPPAGAAFLLAQIGAHAATRFAERIGGELGLTPPLSGVLRLVAREPGLNQQTLATRLGVLPSKMVALVDDLEGRGLLERRRSTTDRRSTSLHLTPAGQGTMAELGRVARDHELAVTAALDPGQREQLVGLLQKLADEQGLTRGVHPGYRRL